MRLVSLVHIHYRIISAFSMGMNRYEKKCTLAIIYCSHKFVINKSQTSTWEFVLRLLVNAFFPFFSDNDITGVLDHTFCVEHNAYGEIIQHELKPNGKSIPVTQDTKKEYVRYV